MTTYLVNGDPKLDSKIAGGFLRTSQILRTFHSQIGQRFSLTPLQIHILKTIKYNTEVTSKNLTLYLALNKATISKSIQLLKEKNMIREISHTLDQRSFFYHLTSKAKKILNHIEKEEKNLIFPSLPHIQSEKKIIYHFLLHFIHHALSRGYIQKQNMCYACKFFQIVKNQPYCNFLNKKLLIEDLEYNCKDFIAIPEEKQ